MKLPNENAISMVVILLIMLVITSILGMTNKFILSKYTHKKIRIRNDLHKIFQEFCEREDVDEPKIVESNSFWYRPIIHTVGVKNFESSYLIDAFAFVHELYHSKDRNRLLKIQSIVSIYTYLISVLLKIIALYSIWFGKKYFMFKPILIIDVIILLTCLLLTLIIESYASNEAISFLKENKYIQKKQLVESIAFYAKLSYCYQFIAYILLSIILFYLI
ncbi:hypothetical protein HO483_01690 [Streptococcus suis]|nr:hypothetical protein [Streptococcus suis]NQK66966.1 hypothetical protein [Streptococcus suis]